MEENIICVGDFFGIDIFSPLKTIYPENIHIKKFPNGVMHNLINKNEYYYDIIKHFEEFKYDYAFFSFGFIDIYLFYYTRKYFLNEPKTNFNYILSSIDPYVKFIASLPNTKNKFILSVLACPVDEVDFPKSLVHYRAVNEEQANNIELKDYSNDVLLDRCEKFNNEIEKCCKKYKVEFVNFYKDLFKKNKIYKIFKVVHLKSNLNYVYEYIIIFLLNTHLKFLKNKINYKKLIENANIAYNLYLKARLQRFHKQNLYETNKFNNEKINKFINNYLELKNKK